MNLFLKLFLSLPSALYGVGVEMRNAFFDMGLLKSKEFNLPVIGVGNITIGGTGKTPHVEYIVSVLKDDYRVAVLSRGYKRKSKGFVLASPDSTVEDLGDEPYQIYKKFDNITVACCADRVKGVNRLLAMPEPPEVIVLDDVFQHRYIKPRMNILLTDYNRPMYEDHILPLGRLRERYADAKRRATHVIVTKCPESITPIGRRVIHNNLELYPFQDLYYSRVVYSSPRSYAGETVDCGFKEWLEGMAAGSSILLFTGIASPGPLLDFIKENYKGELVHRSFADHHRFTKRDIAGISQAYSELKGEDKVVLTTEKDFVRLSGTELPEWKNRMYCVPIELRFMYGSENISFKDSLIKYVEDNRRNGKVLKK